MSIESEIRTIERKESRWTALGLAGALLAAVSLGASLLLLLNGASVLTLGIAVLLLAVGGTTMATASRVLDGLLDERDKVSRRH